MAGTLRHRAHRTSAHASHGRARRCKHEPLDGTSTSQAGRDPHQLRPPSRADLAPISREPRPISRQPGLHPPLRPGDAISQPEIRCSGRVRRSPPTGMPPGRIQARRRRRDAAVHVSSRYITSSRLLSRHHVITPPRRRPAVRSARRARHSRRRPLLHQHHLLLFLLLLLNRRPLTAAARSSKSTSWLL